MKLSVSIGMLVWLSMIYANLFSPIAWADRLTLKDGTQIEGVVKQVEKGEVAVQVGAETKTFNILDISNMVFDTPRVSELATRLPGTHFMASMEAQKVVGHIESVERAAAELRQLIDQTKQDWGQRRSIDTSDLPRWTAAKERFSAPVSNYQEGLTDLYVHVLGKVSQYNQLMQEANQIYVGVKGLLNTGSSLVPKEKEKLPLKKYVPATWYDTIYYEGYNRGYNEAFEKFRNNTIRPD